jgi:hypothetical protein
VSIPDAPPLTKGFTVGHTPVALDFFWPPILFLDSKTERLGAQRERGRDSKRKKKWLPQKKKKKKKKKKKTQRKENAEKTVERDPFRKRWKGICKAGQHRPSLSIMN